MSDSLHEHMTSVHVFCGGEMLLSGVFQLNKHGNEYTRTHTSKLKQRMVIHLLSSWESYIFSLKYNDVFHVRKFSLVTLWQKTCQGGG